MRKPALFKCCSSGERRKVLRRSIRPARSTKPRFFGAFPVRSRKSNGGGRKVLVAQDLELVVIEEPDRLLGRLLDHRLPLRSPGLALEQQLGQPMPTTGTEDVAPEDSLGGLSIVVDLAFELGQASRKPPSCLPNSCRRSAVADFPPRWPERPVNHDPARADLPPDRFRCGGTRGQGRVWVLPRIEIRESGGSSIERNKSNRKGVGRLSTEIGRSRASSSKEVHDYSAIRSQWTPTMAGNGRVPSRLLSLTSAPLLQYIPWPDASQPSSRRNPYVRSCYGRFRDRLASRPSCRSRDTDGMRG